MSPDYLGHYRVAGECGDRLQDDSDKTLVHAHPIPANAIAQGQFALFNQQNNSFSVPYGDFYLGVRTFSDFGENIQGFGWARLNNSVSGLTLLGSAITYDQPGIVVGTTTTIPEAGPMMLLLPAVTIIALGRRSRRPHRRPSAAGFSRP